MYQFIPLLTWLLLRHFAWIKCGDSQWQRLKWNVNTEQRDETVVAAQSWVWEWIELHGLSATAFINNSVVVGSNLTHANIL